ncbi:MAG TPA: sulfatase [Candidatus Nitrosotenuis sp.]|nr:sulfatase [Candidatus Nitrosotenuis sp.]
MNASSAMESGKQESGSAANILLLAGWLGVLTGLLEGSLLFVFQKLDWLNWTVVPVSREIIWISAVANVVLFLAVGAVCCGLRVFLSKEKTLICAAWLFFFLLFLDLFGFSARIRLYAAVMLALGMGTVVTRWFRGHRTAVQIFVRKTIVAFVILAAAIGLGVEASIWLPERTSLNQLPPAAAGAPNVLVVVWDTVRADHLSTYGYSRATSPHLDSFAREATLFENAIATSSWTLPTHASMLTGLYPYEHGAQAGALDEKSPTLGEFLQKHGYRTAAFSANTAEFTRKQGFQRGFIRFEDFFGTWRDRLSRTFWGHKVARYLLPRLGYEDMPGRKLAEDVNQSALRWLDRTPDRPFFLFLNYFDPHDPYLPPAPFRSKFSKVPKPGGIINFYLQRYEPKLTPEQMQEERDAYDGAIAYCDDQFGKLLAELQRRGLDKNTIVVMTSDHGESFGEHGLITHRNALYRELIHVPWAIRWPGRVPAGRRIAVPVSHVALPATLADLLGVSTGSPFRGPSLAQLWNAAEPPKDWAWPLAELAQLKYEPLKHLPLYHGRMRSMVSADWQFIWHEKFGIQLYDWRADVAQANDLAKSAAHADVVRRFEEELKARSVTGHNTGQP